MALTCNFEVKFLFCSRCCKVTGQARINNEMILNDIVHIEYVCLECGKKRFYTYYASKEVKDDDKNNMPQM